MCAPRLLHAKQGEAQAFFLQMGTQMRVCIRDSLLLHLPVGTLGITALCHDMQGAVCPTGCNKQRYSLYGAAFSEDRLDS